MLNTVKISSTKFLVVSMFTITIPSLFVKYFISEYIKVLPFSGDYEVVLWSLNSVVELKNSSFFPILSFFYFYFTLF